MNMNYQYLYYQPGYGNYQQGATQETAIYEADNQE